MRPRSLDEFLTKARVPYTTFRHAPAFTAMHAAAISHVPGRSWAKTVVCVADGEVVLAVVPAHYTIDLDKLRELAGASALRLATRTRDRGAVSRIARKARCRRSAVSTCSVSSSRSVSSGIRKWCSMPARTPTASGCTMATSPISPSRSSAASARPRHES